ncbi:hypothetical protein QTG54_009639 [Skeletonema marinoi]|uniref:Uncharacterized protein n=1 Tax=Skeletonema marinoi TaxID=267567 RepID=A0AAD8Y771_9STRA|nr:hypothetical protein QTG54_009639 [Skeletonema marinoi]
MTLSNNSSFLNKLSTLRDFVTGMGMKVSESDFSFNVELALERILTGDNSASYDNSSGGVVTSSSSFAASSKKSSAMATPSSKKRSAAAIKSSTKATPKSSNHNKRSRPATFVQLVVQSVVTEAANIHRATAIITTDYSYANDGHELLDFTQNWKNNTHSTSSSATPIDPMVRFRSTSGNVEGSLNSYLCSSMSENLLNDPIEFFDLFSNNGGGGGVTDSKLFFSEGKGSGGRRGKGEELPLFEGNKSNDGGDGIPSKKTILSTDRLDDDDSDATVSISNNNDEDGDMKIIPWKK